MTLSPDAGLLRECRFPVIWCAGCGNGIVLGALVRAIDKLGLDQDRVCLVSGIGCSSRIPAYADFSTVHTTHGRAIAFATGVKLARPELTVVVVTGDGDATAIGGNHLLHAARRNVDLTVVLVNNSIYGMTGGQASPTTPTGMKGTTAPMGQFEQTLDAVQVALAAGAPFAARTTTYHARPMQNLIAKAIQHPGFALVEVMAACPTYFGRMNKQGTPIDMLLWQKEHSIDLKRASELPAEERQDKVPIGTFRDEPRPEWCAQYAELQRRAQGGDR